MDFDAFLLKITHIKTKKLGGLTAQFKLAPKLRLQYSKQKIKAQQPKKAATLALFYPNKDNQTHFLLTERANYKGTHSGQISFPGGKIEKTDPNLVFTALREANEEVGIPPNSVKIIREMTDVYIPPSNFLATPFLGISTQTPIFKKNKEVASLIEISLQDLLNEKNISSQIKNTSYMKEVSVPCFILNGYVVWGATAMMLAEIKDLLQC